MSNAEFARAEAKRTHLLILADDLTGTADSAIGCIRQGLTTQVMLSAKDWVSGHAVAIDLDTRACPAQQAADRHRDCLDHWRARYRFLFKKVDSTLRGNVAAEIASLVPSAGMAIVAPAYPATGRTTRDGRQWLNGQPVEDTEVWINEGITGRADLIEMLEGASLRTAYLNLDTLNGADNDVIATLKTHQREGIQAVVCDAESDADLRRLASLSAAVSDIFWVGSAGLGEMLPEALSLAGRVNQETFPAAPSRPTLIVIGSMSAMSHAQADALVDHADALDVIEIEAATLRPTAPEGARIELTQRVSSALAEQRDVMVRLRQSSNRNAAEGPQLSLALGDLLAPHLADVDRLIATGGATARALLMAADITELTLIGAPDTGMARLQARHGNRRLEVITKAGGFGDTYAFQRIWIPQTPTRVSQHNQRTSS